LKRREFITLLGGAAAAWPLAAQAQAERVRRVGVLQNFAADDAEGQVRLTAFGQGLQQLGWTVGRNLRIDYGWSVGDAERIRKSVADIVALSPDIILAAGGRNMTVLQQANRTIPVVFVTISDPVSGGFVESMSHPGGNATGFSILEWSMTGKWLELLKQLVPQMTRVAVLRDPNNPGGTGQLGAIQGVAPTLGVAVTPVGIRDAVEIERGLMDFARSPNGGLIVTSSILTEVHRDLIIALAGRHRLPAIYSARYLVVAGGLLSYGPDLVDQYRLAAGYVDRILKGEKPANLPVQAPTKYQLVINLKTAKTLGLEVPPTLLASADEVIE
jgi:putative tryptophan/tyrosine transport system substrate-binding protein